MAQQQQPQQFRPAYNSPHSTPSPMTPGAAQSFAPPKGSQLSPNTPSMPYQPLQSPPAAGPNGSHSSYNPYAHQNANPYPLPQQSPVLAPGQPPVRNISSPQPHNAQQPHFQHQGHPQQQIMMPQSQPAPTQGTMGPPASKPDDGRGPDLNDISDVIYGSGVDLRAEEAALANQPRRGYPYAGQPGHFDPQRNSLHPNTPGGRNSFYGSGAFNQQGVPMATLEEQAEAKKRIALRARAERLQFHNNEPFLLQKTVMERINRAAQKCQTGTDMNGVYQPQANTRNRLVITGPEGQDRIATLSTEPLITAQSPMSDILTLLSLAAREKVRTALEDSVAMTRSRKLTHSGIVPPDFQDIATGQGKSKEAMGEPVPLIGEESPSGNSRKRSHSQSNELPTPDSDASPNSPAAKKAPTISFSELVHQDLLRRQSIEDKFEEERLAKRARRETAKLINGGTERAGSIGGTPGPGTPGASDSIAPELNKMTKKEQKKKQEAEAMTSAAQGTKNAVSMALGGGKRPAWMTAGKSGGGLGGTSFGKRNKSVVTPAKKAAENAAGTNGTTGAAEGTAKPKNLGGAREDREDGSGIEMRDVILVLKDGKEKRTLSRAFSKLKG